MLLEMPSPARIARTWQGWAQRYANWVPVLCALLVPRLNRLAGTGVEICESRVDPDASRILDLCSRMALGGHTCRNVRKKSARQ
jgi:hypothetical protein